jgi:hypothetical protein
MSVIDRASQHDASQSRERERRVAWRHRRPVHAQGHITVTVGRRQYREQSDLRNDEWFEVLSDSDGRQGVSLLRLDERPRSCHLAVKKHSVR